MPLVKRESIENLRARVSLYDVVAPAVTLRQRGRDFWGLSPFTQEKTPSFKIDPERGFYKCFSSGEAGDLFSFVQKTENLTFQEAVEVLAERFGVPLEYEQGEGPSAETRSLKSQLLEIHEQATEYFHRAFLADRDIPAQVRAYWTEKRGFSLELAQEFKIGLAPIEPHALAEYLDKKGFSRETLLASGLFFDRNAPQNPRRLMARFRGRLMIPVRDIHGQVIAFSARQLDITPQDDPSREAKYLNSPETAIFHKSRVLFNLDRARTAVGSNHPMFCLVEGQLDALRCHSCGLTTAIAPQGTAITAEQLGLLRRYDAPLHVLLDGDAAGQKAALRLLPLALAAGLDVRFRPLAKGTDPDDLLRAEGLAGFESLPTLGAMAFAVRALHGVSGTLSPHDKGRLMRQISAMLKGCDTEVARAAYLDEAAHLLGVDPKAAQADLARTRPSPPSANGTPTERKLRTLEEDLLALIAGDNDLTVRALSNLEEAWLDTSAPEGQVLLKMTAEVKEGLWEDDKFFLNGLENEAERDSFARVLMEDRTEEDREAQAEHCLRGLLTRYLRHEINGIDRAVAQGGQTRDEQRRLQERRRALKQLQLQPPALLLN